ncbi:MAG: ABC transporter permease [Thermoprotei archaeon]|jgi:putative ABC transport system permease protein|nr:ABC transporter permease [Thermoprotei archaeon]
MAIRTLGQRKIRSVLTILGILIGPAVIITIGAVVGGYSQYIINQVSSLGQNNIMITPSSDYTLTNDDLNFFRSQPNVDRAEPYYLTQAIVKRGDKDLQVYVYCTDVEFILQSIGGIKIESGEAPSSSDILGALIGYKIAYDDNNNLVYGIGDVVPVKYYASIKNGIPQYKTTNVIVRGITAEYGGALFFSPDQTIFTPLDAGQKIFGMKEWSGVIVRMTDPAYVKEFVNTVRNTYGDKVSVISFSAIADVVSSITAAVSYVNYVASLSAVAVAVAGTTATMVTSVIERTREIGVMKAIGYTNGKVIIMILSESLLMSFAAAASGSALGVLGALYLGRSGMMIKAGTTSITLSAHPLFTASLFISAVSLTVMVGIIGGLLPAYMAAKIPPAVALRYE